MGIRGDGRKIVTQATTASVGFVSDDIFEKISEALQADGENLVKKVKGVYCFVVTGGPDGTQAKWVVDAKNGSGSVTKDGTTKADCTITMKDADLVDLMNGTLNPQRAFFQGKLKIKGNMGLAMKLQEFQKTAQNHLQSKL
ncbi:unnamed protein product [Meganyctiphanes norvegica]|uniref:SCP2 domain-containing protein n=1 Tax=Meganyctiphanes norvegica TaxID=48144 RepID=A0AAV2QRK7_MEGNR